MLVLRGSFAAWLQKYMGGLAWLGSVMDPRWQLARASNALRQDDAFHATNAGDKDGWKYGSHRMRLGGVNLNPLADLCREKRS
jgi:hypothetical protein